MSKGSWAQLKPADWVDPDAFLFLGADPAWTPEKEDGRAVAPRTGLCPLCGGKGHHGRDAGGGPAYLPGAIPDGSHGVCGRCHRYGLDRILDRSRPLASRPGRDDAGSHEPDGRPGGGKLDLSSLVVSVKPVAEPGFVTKVVTAGTVTVPERFAYLLDET